MEYGILYLKDELENKDRSHWDEVDWDTYYYLLSLEEEA